MTLMSARMPTDSTPRSTSPKMAAASWVCVLTTCSIGTVPLSPRSFASENAHDAAMSPQQSRATLNQRTHSRSQVFLQYWTLVVAQVASVRIVQCAPASSKPGIMLGSWSDSTMSSELPCIRTAAARAPRYVARQSAAAVPSRLRAAHGPWPPRWSGPSHHGRDRRIAAEKPNWCRISELQAPQLPAGKVRYSTHTLHMP